MGAFQHSAFQDSAYQDGVGVGIEGTKFYTHAGTMRAMGRRHRILLWFILGSSTWL